MCIRDRGWLIIGLDKQTIPTQTHTTQSHILYPLYQRLGFQSNAVLTKSYSAWAVEIFVCFYRFMKHIPPFLFFNFINIRINKQIVIILCILNRTCMVFVSVIVILFSTSVTSSLELCTVIIDFAYKEVHFILSDTSVHIIS